jgi:hypothetical protein
MHTELLYAYTIAHFNKLFLCRVMGGDLDVGKPKYILKSSSTMKSSRQFNVNSDMQTHILIKSSLSLHCNTTPDVKHSI